MVTSYRLRPEVAGGLGPGTVLDGSVHPPRVDRLHYVFESWLGDDLVESFPCFLASEQLAAAIDGAGLTGAAWAEPAVTTDGQFRLLFPELAGSLPKWRWLQPSGDERRSDFWVDADGGLHVSESALRVLQGFTLDHATVEADLT
jgi:hypothetical protein